MVFRCQLCGECCSTMGEIIGIREEIGPLQFRIWYTTTGEERVVAVDRDKVDLFHAGTAGGSSRACPFLRRRGTREFVCSVHGSRPDLCRQYSCFRILALDSSGKKAGRVMDASRYLVTGNPDLRMIWRNAVQDVVIPDEREWEAYVAEVLTRKGFRVVR
jgi:Fe-S-cluster containining protein